MPSDAVASVPQGQYASLNSDILDTYVFRLRTGAKGKKNKKKKGGGKQKGNEQDDSQKQNSTTATSDFQAESSNPPVCYYLGQNQFEGVR